LLLALAGCAHDATPLPPVGAAQRVNVAPMSESARLARCEALRTEVATFRSEIATIREVMAGRRTEDQVGGYLAGLLFPPIVLVADQQTSRKAALDERQAKVDQRLAEEGALRCPSEFMASP
jgi:hypothetical protein